MRPMQTPIDCGARFSDLDGSVQIWNLAGPFMLRGGSWINNGQNCRSASRNRNTSDNRNNKTGFRPTSTFVGKSGKTYGFCWNASKRSGPVMMMGYVPVVGTYQGSVRLGS